MPASATEKQQIRIEVVGDSTDSTTLADAVIDYHWDNDGSADVLETAVLCAESLAAYEARRFPFSTPAQSMQMHVRQAQYQATADRLRARLAARTTTVTLTATATVEEDEEFA